MGQATRLQELKQENVRLHQQVQQQERELEELRKLKNNSLLTAMSGAETLSASTISNPLSADDEPSLTPIATPQLSLQPEFQPKSDDQYQLNDLLRYHDDHFVQNAFRATFKRMPEVEENRYYIEGLRSGHFDKTDILARLRFSAEGKAKGVRIKGLRLPAGVRQIGRIPVLGYFVRLISALVRLPVAIRNQQRFEAYSFVLHRQIADHVNLLSAQIISYSREVARPTQKSNQRMDDREEEIQRRMGLFGLRVRELEEKHRSVQEQVKELTAQLERGQEKVR